MRLALTFVALTLASPAMAQSASLKTTPGKVVQVGFYSFLKNDCSGGAKPTFKLGSPVAHGQLIVKDATLTTKRLTNCGTVKAPTLVVVYKADATFTGSVPLSFDVTNTETGAAQHIDATVDVVPDRQKI